MLAVWGKHDPFFLPAGSQGYKRDNSQAEVHLLDAGHFALATHGQEITALIRDFLGRKLQRERFGPAAPQAASCDATESMRQRRLTRVASQ